MTKKLLCLAIAITFVLTSVTQEAVWAKGKPQPNQLDQTRPIELGTSGGNINDNSALYCCSGTLGALVEDPNGIQYILSNNHVMGRLNQALVGEGEGINQPGQIDQNCEQTGLVANFSDLIEIMFDGSDNQVDASIAQVIDGTVRTDGAIIGIGTLSSETVTAFLGLAVKKSGRTTGLTRGSITAIDVDAKVSYSQECGSSSVDIAFYSNQLLIQSRRFSGGGDSGSLIVEDVDSNPRAVGLLFAGNADGSITVANPIDLVLAGLGVTMVGGISPPPPPGAGDTITGTVTTNDPSPIPLAGAKVVVVETNQQSTTDSQGDYTINDVSPGDNYSVKASSKGFTSQTIEGVVVTEGQSKVVDFALAAKVKGGKSSSGVRGNAAIAHARNVKNIHKAKLFDIEGVVGMGIGLSASQEPVIEVYLAQETTQRSKIPATLDGVPVKVLVTGPFEAF